MFWQIPSEGENRYNCCADRSGSSGCFLVGFLKTRLGLAIRATGNNADMVKSSSINPVFTTIIGLLYLQTLFTALSDAFFPSPRNLWTLTSVGNGYHCACIPSDRRNNSWKRRNFCKSCGNGIGFFCFPTGLYGGFKIQYAGIYAETGIFCDRCAGYFRSIFEKTVAAD